MLHRTFQLYRSSFAGLSRDVWFLALVLFINRAGTMVIPFLTIYLTGQKHFSMQEAGLVMSMFGAGSVLGSYVGGRLTDRIGYYPVQFWTLLLSGFCFFLLGQMESLWAICLAIFLLSTIADAFRPANQASVATYSKPENLTRSYALMRLAVNLGFAAGPAIGGILAATVGYQALFLVDGFTCLAAALIFRIGLSPKEQRSREELEEPVPSSGPAISAYRNVPYLGFIFFNILYAIAFMQFFSSLPIYLKEEIGMTEVGIGGLVAINAVMIVLMEMPLVYSLENKYSQLKVIAFGSVLTAVGYMVFNLPFLTALLPFVFIVLLTMGEMLSMPFTSSYAIQQAGPLNRGEYMGLFSIGFAIALIVAPSLGLWLAEDYGFSTLWLVVGALALLSGLGFLLLERKREGKKWSPVL